MLYTNFTNIIVRETVKGNEKLQAYGGSMNRNLLYVTGRGDGSLGVIPEAASDFETTVRNTAIKSEIGRINNLSGKQFSYKENTSEVSPSTIRTNCKSHCSCI